MSVGEADELSDAIRLRDGVRIRDHDVLAARRLDPLVDVGGEAEPLLVLEHAHVGRRRVWAAAAAVRHDDELVDLGVQLRERLPQHRRLAGPGHNQDRGDLHAASTLR